MRVYWELARAGFRRYSRYRTAVWAAVFTNTIFGLVRASLLLAAIDVAGHPVGGYDASRSATYVWLSQALLGPLDVWGSTVDVGQRIRTGDIAVDLSRPLSVLGTSVATTLGRAAFELVPRGAPPLLLGWLLTGLSLPHAVAPYLVGALSLVLATALCHCYYFAVSLSALWTLENRGFLVIAMVVQQVLCGFVVPVSWFPRWLHVLAVGGPFPSMFQAPVDLFTSAVTGTGMLRLVAVQAGWLVLAVGACELVLAAGRRRVVVQGG